MPPRDPAVEIRQSTPRCAWDDAVGLWQPDGRLFLVILNLSRENPSAPLQELDGAGRGAQIGCSSTGTVDDTILPQSSVFVNRGNCIWQGCCQVGKKPGFSMAELVPATKQAKKPVSNVRQGTMQQPFCIWTRDALAGSRWVVV
jgi:hypothetical protein